jgi:hypothetical protein
MVSIDRERILKASTTKFFNQNRNFLQVNQNVSAQDLLAILQDHYDQFISPEDPPFGTKNPNFQTNSFEFRRKKKKVAGDSPNRIITEKTGFQNKFFTLFINPFDCMEDLMSQLNDINKTCEREINKNLNEVFLLVQSIH